MIVVINFSLQTSWSDLLHFWSFYSNYCNILGWLSWTCSKFFHLPLLNTVFFMDVLFWYSMGTFFHHLMIFWTFWSFCTLVGIVKWRNISKLNYTDTDVQHVHTCQKKLKKCQNFRQINYFRACFFSFFAHFTSVIPKNSQVQK